MKKITIIMPFLNEDDEPIETIRSLYSSSDPSLFNVIAIDDCSDKVKKLDEIKKTEGVTYIRNSQREGVDKCRQIGADLTQTPYLFIIDAHMRFKKDDWMRKIINCLEKEPNTAWCTTCLGLGYGNMNINKCQGKYYGANMFFIDENAAADRPSREILEPKWASKKNGIEYEVPCILGANYAFSKSWFDYIKGLNGLRMWGTSEPFLSLKTWMAGGKSKIRTDIEIGHKFRTNAPYVTNISSLIYNKIFVCKTIFPDEVANKLISHIPHDNNFNKAMAEIIKNNNDIIEHRKYYDQIFKYSIYDYCKEFDIKGI